jgi:hypothetical protein
MYTVGSQSQCMLFVHTSLTRCERDRCDSEILNFFEFCLFFKKDDERFSVQRRP